jgi:hypothetical protein
MGAAVSSEGGVISARPWVTLGRLADVSREASRRRRAALGGARIFAQTALAVLDRTETRREGLGIASLFSLGAADELVRAAGLDARTACQVELETLQRLSGLGLLGALGLRHALRRQAHAPRAAAFLAAGADALCGWLRGEDPAPRLEALLRRELPARCAPARPAAGSPAS